MTTDELNALSKQVIGTGIHVHRTLGPGLDECIYEETMHIALNKLGVRSERQVAVPLDYKGCILECGYRLDLLVEGALVLELKSVARSLAIHEAQLLTYLKISGHQLGLLMNFNVLMLKDGIQRFVNRFGMEPLVRAIPSPSPKKAPQDLSGMIIHSAIEVHRALGPGLLRTAYQECLVWELVQHQIPVHRDVQRAVFFDEVELGSSLKVELLVDGNFPVGVVSVEEITPLLEAQFHSRLRLGGYQDGLLINFNTLVLRDGVRRFTGEISPQRTGWKRLGNAH